MPIRRSKIGDVTFVGMDAIDFQIIEVVMAGFRMPLVDVINRMIGGGCRCFRKP
jgi:hypothetical protein